MYLWNAQILGSVRLLSANMSYLTPIADKSYITVLFFWLKWNDTLPFLGSLFESSLSLEDDEDELKKNECTQVLFTIFMS